MSTVLFSFFIGLIASFYGSFTGGAGMLSIPVLIFIGIPADIAVASNKMGDFGRFTTSAFKFIRSQQVVWKLVFWFIPISIIGGVIGAFLLSKFEVLNLQKITGVMIIAFIPVLLLSKKIGIENIETSSVKKKNGMICYFLMSIYGASIQIGSGPIIIYLISWFFGTTLIQSNATSSIAWFFTTVSSLASLIYLGYVNFHIGIPLMIGSSIGGYLGAHTALSKGNKWTKAFFTIVVLAMALKIILDSTYH